MRKNILKSLAMAFFFIGALASASCGGKNTESLAADVNAVNEKIAVVATDSPQAVSAFSLALDEAGVKLNANVNDKLFDLKLLEPSLADFAVASYLHSEASDENLTGAINELSKNELPFELELTQGSEKFNQAFTGARLKTLYKESLPNLNRTTAAANAAQLVGSWASNVFNTEGASDFECVYSTNRIVINVTFPNVDASPLKGVSNPNSALKGMLADAADAHYALYGALRPAVSKLMVDMGVKELRLTYKYTDGKPAPSVRLEWGSDL